MLSGVLTFWKPITIGRGSLAVWGGHRGGADGGAAGAVARGRPTHQMTMGRSGERRRSAPLGRHGGNRTTRRHGGVHGSWQRSCATASLVSNVHLLSRPRPPSTRPPAVTCGTAPHLTPPSQSYCALTRAPSQPARASGWFRPTPANGARRMSDGEQLTRSANSCIAMSTGTSSPCSSTMMSPTLTPAASATPERSVTWEGEEVWTGARSAFVSLPCRYKRRPHATAR